MERDGFELLRLLFQDHLDCEDQARHRATWWAAMAYGGPHVAACSSGSSRSFSEPSWPDAWAYSAQRRRDALSRDAELNLPPSLYSHGVERRVSQRKSSRARSTRRWSPWP